MLKNLKAVLQKIYAKLLVILFDLAAIPIAWSAAYWLRYNLHPYPWRLNLQHFFTALCLLTLVQLASYYYFKIYRGLWRFASLNDEVRIAKACVSAIIFIIPIFYLTSILTVIPRSVLPLYCMILFLILSTGRLVIRLYWDRRGKIPQGSQVSRLLIVGAGQAGESLVRDLKRNMHYQPIGFIDDNLSKLGLEVHGVRVLGPIDAIETLVAQHKVHLIFIAIPSASSANMRRIVDHCERSGVMFRTLPSFAALAAGRVEVNALRAVNLEDLLGRDQVVLDWDKIVPRVSGKRVLVTGGGGSIGSELCRQIVALAPASLAIIESSEFNLYQMEQELQGLDLHFPIQLGLFSITDEVAVHRFFMDYQPELVFHAAAYKHVPMLEGQIRSAVLNNVLGTEVVAQASLLCGVEKFILISTDKAVRPKNVMGASKRVAEIYCQSLNAHTKTEFITVRFGNVLGSAGSVVPLFQKQMQLGGPLTVTHPKMQRYFMTIPEACQLILQAMANGSGGEIFVLDMGEPIQISYLAEQMIRLAGKELGKDIHIEYTGLRAGEKLYEELFYEREVLLSTAHKKLFKAQFQAFDWELLSQMMQKLHKACYAFEEEELLVLLQHLVPDLCEDEQVVTPKTDKKSHAL